MTFQSNMNIKEESLSPSSSCVSSSDGSNVYMFNYPMNVGSTRDQCDTPELSDGSPPVKRIRCENDDLLTSNPETKKKLKNVVLGRRRARGVMDIPTSLFPTPISYQLTPADIEKRVRRKKQNREAAKRCRAKKKAEQDLFAQETATHAETNEKLQEEIRSNLQTILILRTVLKEHLNCGDCKLCSIVQEQHKLLTDESHNLILPLDKVQLPQKQQMPRQTFMLTDGSYDCVTVNARIGMDQSSINDSNCVQVYTAPKNELTDYANPVERDSGGQDADNLCSWDDISNIPTDQIFSLLNSGLNQNSSSDINSTINPSLLVPIGELQQNPQPASVNHSSQRDEFFNQDSISESNYLSQLPHQKSFTLNNLPHTTDQIHNETMFDENQDSVELYTCVHPNLVQPNSTSNHSDLSVSYATDNQCSNGTSIYNINLEMLNHQINANTDVNSNNISRCAAKKHEHTNINNGRLPFLDNNIPTVHFSNVVNVQSLSNLKCDPLSHLSLDEYRR